MKPLDGEARARVCVCVLVQFSRLGRAGMSHLKELIRLWARLRRCHSSGTKRATGTGRTGRKHRVWLRLTPMVVYFCSFFFICFAATGATGAKRAETFKCSKRPCLIRDLTGTRDGKGRKGGSQGRHHRRPSPANNEPFRCNVGVTYFTLATEPFTVAAVVASSSTVGPLAAPSK